LLIESWCRPTDSSHQRGSSESELHNTPHNTGNAGNESTNKALNQGLDEEPKAENP